MANELQLAAGLKLTNPAPADAYYCLPQVGQAPAQPYASPAQACAYVVQALRYQGMPVFVAGIGRMSWSTSDLSDAGLLAEGTNSAPSPSGGAALPTDFAFDVTKDGAQSYALPADATRIDHPLQVQQKGSGVVRTILREHCRIAGGNLIVDAAAKLLTGDRLNGGYYGGTTTTSAPTPAPVPASAPTFSQFLTPQAPGNNVRSLTWAVTTGWALRLGYNPEVQETAPFPYPPMRVYLGGTAPANYGGKLTFAEPDKGHQCGVVDEATNKLYYLMQIIASDGTLGPVQGMAFYSGSILLVA